MYAVPVVAAVCLMVRAFDQQKYRYNRLWLDSRQKTIILLSTLSAKKLNH